MSIIIDEIIFETESENQTLKDNITEQNIVYQIFKLLKIHQKSFLSRNDQKLYQIRSLVALPQSSFIVQLEMHKISKITRLEAIIIEQFQFQKVWSRQNEILLVKSLMKHQKELSIEFNIYVNQGRIVMAMNNFLQITKQTRPLRVAQAYNQIIMKSLRNFEAFVLKYLRKIRLSPDEKEKEIFFHKQMQLARILHSTENITNISANKSQYKSANQIFQKQKEQLTLIQKNIEEQNIYEISLNQLFFNIPEDARAPWLRANFIPFYQFTYKKFKTLLSIVKQSGEKKIEDFIFNMAKIQVKDMFNGGKPIGQGGSSMIFVARALIVFISSTDLVSYPQNTQKVERVIAIKKLKNADQRKYKDKLDHQKKIVAKMRSSVCQFIPKYYGTETDNSLSNSLVMEMVQGEEMDFYISSHIETISLWTKLTLLLNVIHGMKHLVNYQIVHLDLKPTNIMVCKNLITKIIDFGQAYQKQFCPSNYVPGFTFPYVAPEVYIKVLKSSFNKPNNNLQFTQKQDVFAFGIIMYDVIFESKAFTFSNNKSKEIYAKRQILNRFFIAPEKTQYYGQELIMSTILYLIIRCIDPVPSKRPCFEWIGIVLKLILNSQNNIH